MTPEKQEVDDLRSEVGSLRLQVTDMDSRIDALSRMVDRLLEERSAGAAAGADVKHEISPAAGWAKKRRLDGEWDGTADVKESEGGAGVVRAAAGPPRVKMESGEDATVKVKAELSEATSSTSLDAAAGGADCSDGMIIGGGALSRNASFLRDLDNMSIGSMMSGGGGSLGPLELIDVTTGDDGNGSGNLDAMNESFFDIDFEAEITSMPGSNPSSKDDQQEEQQKQTSPSANDPSATTEASSEQTPSASTVAAVVPANDSPAPPAPTPLTANGGRALTAAAPETPEIAMPLASAALGAFMVHYANAKAVKEPSNAVAAVAMDTSRHAIERTAS